MREFRNCGRNPEPVVLPEGVRANPCALHVVPPSGSFGCLARILSAKTRIFQTQKPLSGGSGRECLIAEDLMNVFLTGGTGFIGSYVAMAWDVSGMKADFGLEFDPREKISEHLDCYIRTSGHG
jgi:hypothetical protein